MESRPPIAPSASLAPSPSHPMQLALARRSHSTPSTGASGSRSGCSSCALCEGSNFPAVCSVCVNQSLGEYYQYLRSRRLVRGSLKSRLEAKLDAKKKADEQQKFIIRKREEIKKLKDRLSNLEKVLDQEKGKVKEATAGFQAKNEALKIAVGTLRKRREELLEKSLPNLLQAQNLGLMAVTSQRLYAQSLVIKKICKLFPLRQVNVERDKDGYNGSYDQICNARLPRGLDPHSVPPVELAASLGYVVQLLNLLIPVLGAPLLHNSGFAGSCSRIWQRQSYWNARPSQNKDYPLFISKQDYRSHENNSWAERSTNDFGVASVNSEVSDRKPYLDRSESSSFSMSIPSPNSIEKYEDLQQGISLLKRSVACITAYCYNSLGLDLPSDASTFESFRRVLAILSSAKEHRSASALQIASSRSCKEQQQLSGSIWSLNSGSSPSNSLVHSMQTALMPSYQENDWSAEAGFVFPVDINELWKSKFLADEWDIVEHTMLPPPPSQVEDVEHWTRAMILDATRK